MASQWGVSRQTLHGWLAHYEAAGLEGLADRSRRPVSCPHQLDPVVAARLVALWLAHPGWGPDRLAYWLGKEGVGPVPSRAGIARALSRHRLVSEGQRRHRKRVFRRWERARPMELWQADVTGGVLLADGSEVKAVTIP